MKSEQIWSYCSFGMTQKEVAPLRDSFRAYYRPTDDEIAEIWAEGIIVLDTNALLNFFRYTPGTRDEFLEVLEKLSKSLWIPHHVGLEFHRHRLGVISATSEAFTKVTESLVKAKNDIASTVNEFKHHPSLNRSEVSKEIDDFVEALTKKLANQKQEHYAGVIESGDAEQTFQRISDLFSARVGPASTEAELKAFYEEGKIRYTKKIPPGYKDKDDTNPNQYGDLVIWKEILKQGKEKKLPMIFVTDDGKEDWWWKHAGQTQGPRVELVDEYWSHAERRIHFYEPLRFLQYAKKQTNTEVSPESLEEIEEVSSANSRVQRVLRERKVSLEAQQARLLRQFEDSQPKQVDPSMLRKMHSEYEDLMDQQQTLESRMKMARQQVESIVEDMSKHTDTSDRHQVIREFAERRAEIDKLEDHLATVTRNRKTMERQLLRGTDYQHRMMHSRDRQMSQVQAELQEVDLALEELNE